MPNYGPIVLLHIKAGQHQRREKDKRESGKPPLKNKMQYPRKKARMEPPR